MLPELTLCIEQACRMSAVTYIKLCRNADYRLTKIRDRNQVDDSPNKICLLAFHVKSQLPSCPAMRTIAPNYILCPDVLPGRAGSLFWRLSHDHRDWVCSVVFDFRAIKFQFFRHDTPLNSDIRFFLNCIDEKALNSTLMQGY